MNYSEFKNKLQVILKIKEEDGLQLFKHLDRLGTKRVSSITLLQFGKFDIESIGGEIETKLIQGIPVK